MLKKENEIMGAEKWSKNEKLTEDEVNDIQNLNV